MTSTSATTGDIGPYPGHDSSDAGPTDGEGAWTAGSDHEPVMTSLLARIVRIAQEIDTGDDVDAVLQAVSTAVTRHTPWPMCWAGRLDLDEPTVVAAVHSGFDPRVTHDFDLWPAEGSPSVVALTSGEILTIPDVSTARQFPYVRREAIGAGWRSAVIVPVPVAGHHAVLILCRPDVHRFSKAEVALAGMLAAMTAAVFPGVMNPERPELEVLQRVSTLQDRLLHLQVHGGTLADVCRGVSSLIKMPTVVLDRFARPLGAEGLTVAEIDAISRHVAGTDSTRSGDRSVELITVDGRSAIVDRAVGGNNECLASLVAVLPETESPPPELSELLELASKHVALSIIKQRIAIQSDVRLREEFGEALATSGSSDVSLARSAALLGIDLASPHRVLRVHPGGLGRPLSSHDAFDVADIVARRLSTEGIESVVCPVGASDLVVVLRDPERATNTVLTRTVRDAVQTALGARCGPSVGPLDVSIGIGDAAPGVDGLSRSHDEATRALEVARNVEGADTDRSIGEIGSFAVLAAVSGSDQEILLRRYLQPLLDYDREQGGGCVETLTAYFEAVGNVQRTADKLFLHLSTVRYRLRRIEEIAVVDLRDEEDRLCLQLALRLAQLPGKTPGPAQS